MSAETTDGRAASRSEFEQAGRASLPPGAALAADSLVIVPGLRSSGSGHWQTHWRTSLPRARWVEQPDWHTPDLDRWADTVARALAAVNRPVVIAHSFGCFAALAALKLGARIAAAMLVAPADLGRYSLDDRIPWRRLAFRTTLVASTNDPYLKLVRAGELASVWGSQFVPYRDAGHINAESGFGQWPEGLQLLADLLHADDASVPPHPVGADLQRNAA